AFSDGHALTADDVVFSLAAAYAATAGAPTLEVDGKPLRAEALDAQTVAFTFPAIYAPGLRILDRLPVLPRHKLDAALKGHAVESALGLSTPASEVVGAGPFVLREYVPGQRLVFTRNPNYWGRDGSGTP